MNTIGNDESDNKKPDNKKPDNEISDNEKSNNGNTADDYKDGAVTKNALQVITIIGEIEGHDNLPATSKATKYEHMLPKLAEIEMDKDIKGILFIMNTVGGDVSAGLALAEMIASMKKPTVSLTIRRSYGNLLRCAVRVQLSSGIHNPVSRAAKNQPFLLPHPDRASEARSGKGNSPDRL